MGDRIKALRLKAGLAQWQLAEMSGCTQWQISAIERGGISPRLKTLERIAKSLNCTVEMMEVSK